jgi:hypothetical protein
MVYLENEQVLNEQIHRGFHCNVRIERGTNSSVGTSPLVCCFRQKETAVTWFIIYMPCPSNM